MPLPIAHACVGAGIVAAVRPRGTEKGIQWLPLLFGAALANFPDLDFFFAWATHARWLHRGPTHSLFFAFVVGLIFLAVMGASRLREAAGYGLAFMSHGVLDYATTKIGGGVELLWPFSTERFSLGLVGVSELTHGLGLVDMFRASAMEALIFIPLLLAVLLLKGSFTTRGGLPQGAV